MTTPPFRSADKPRRRSYLSDHEGDIVDVIKAVLYCATVCEFPTKHRVTANVLANLAIFADQPGREVDGRKRNPSEVDCHGDDVLNENHLVVCRVHKYIIANQPRNTTTELIYFIKP